MSRYASTILSQFKNYSKCNYEIKETKILIRICCYFMNGQKKVFHGSSYDEVAYVMAGFMRGNDFKEKYINPVLASERRFLFSDGN